MSLSVSPKWLRFLVLALLGAALGADLWAQQVTFLSRRDYPVKIPQATMIADFNGDGKPDVVVTWGLASRASVRTLVGLGGGQLGPGIDSPSGLEDFEATYVKAGDLNGDGKLDMHIVAEGGRHVSLLGNGDGSFVALPVSVFDRTSIGEQSLADFDGDGRLDVVIPSDKGTFFLRGRGDGKFDSPVLIGQENCSGSRPADVNRDSAADVALACTDGVRVLLGNGDGTFRSPVLSPLTGSAKHLALGDFNGDHRLDVVVSELNPPTLRVMLGTADGRFQTTAAYSTPDFAVDLQLGDLNRDGKLDVVGTLAARIRDVYIWRGLGDGSLQQTESLVSPQSTTQTALGTLRREGALDIVTVGGGGNSISVHLNNGRGEFPDNIMVNLGLTMYSMQKHDFNHDGRPDLLISSFEGLLILYGTGKPRTPFRLGWRQPLPTGSSYALVADFNQDGKDDIASVSADGKVIIVFPGNGDGTFTASYSVFRHEQAFKLAVGDFNGDGKPDLATSWVEILLGNGDGTFAAPQKVWQSLNPYFIVSADLNGDRRSDLIFNVQNFTYYGFAVLLSAPGGGFLAPKVFIIPNDRYVQDGRYVDINADGIKDLVLVTVSGNLAAYLGRPGGDFELTFKPTSAEIPSTGNPDNILTGDFNGDGKVDMLAPGVLTNSLPVYLGNSDGTFTYDTSWGASAGPLWAVAGPFTERSRPGYDDLVVLNEDGTLTLLINLTPWAGNPAQE